MILLTQNVADHPNSARAHFGLGRAYQSVGKVGNAKAEYLRALTIDPSYQRARDALAAMK
jgi:Tfp pilus assembly protein PilF